MTERRSGRPTIRCWLLALIHFSLRSSYRLRFSRRRVHAGSAFSFLFFISLHFRSSREMKRHWAPRLFTVALSANDSWKLWLSLINNGKKMAQLSLSTGLRKGKRKKKTVVWCTTQRDPCPRCCWCCLSPTSLEWPLLSTLHLMPDNSIRAMMCDISDSGFSLFLCHPVFFFFPTLNIYLLTGSLLALKGTRKWRYYYTLDGMRIAAGLVL